LGDISELKGLEKVSGAHHPYITATKSMTGHLLGAAGAIEAIAAILSIRHQTIPATINIDQFDPKIPKGTNIVHNTAVSAKVEVAISNTFGFGGHNAVVLFRKYQA
jgi:3-oxoacyl-[acyl-carrier-protein] synthase II